MNWSLCAFSLFVLVVGLTTEKGSISAYAQKNKFEGIIRFKIKKYVQIHFILNKLKLLGGGII